MVGGVVAGDLFAGGEGRGGVRVGRRLVGGFVRRDQFNYYPSNNPFADLAPDLQQETLGQDRTLTNVGIRSDVSYLKGIHNLKAGVTYQQTFLDENKRGLRKFIRIIQTRNVD